MLIACWPIYLLISFFGRHVVILLSKILKSEIKPMPQTVERHYKNNSAMTKNQLALNLTRFFAHLLDEQKRAAISKLIDLSTKRSRSYQGGHVYPS